MPEPGLVERWRARSLASSSIEPLAWWSPAVEAVAERLLAGAGCWEESVAELGRARAAAGIHLDEARGDLQELLALVLAAPSLTLRAVDALTTAWVEEWMSLEHPSGCSDPLTGFASRDYLMTRVDEMRAEAEWGGTGLDSSATLVVVRIDALSDSVHREEQMMFLHEAMHSAFRRGQTVARVGAHHGVAVLSRNPALLLETLSLLELELGLARRAGKLGGTHVWQVALPRTRDALHQVLNDLDS